MTVELIESTLSEPISAVAPDEPAGDSRFGARVPAVMWPATTASRNEVTTRLSLPPFVLECAGSQEHRVRGLGLLLDWLSDSPGHSWQQRWIASGADAAAAGWREVPADWLRQHDHFTAGRHGALCTAVLVAIAADIVRPSLDWLVSAGIRSLAAAHDLMETRDPDGFTRLRQLCDSDSLVSERGRDYTLRRAALILAAKGGTVSEITSGDVLELLDTEARSFRNPRTHGADFYSDDAPNRGIRRLRPAAAKGATPRRATPGGGIDRPLPTGLPADP